MFSSGRRHFHGLGSAADSDILDTMSTQPPAKYDDLTALILNCSLKPGRETSHTDGLLNIPKSIFEQQGVKTELLRAVDFSLAPGVKTDMSETFPDDGWPKLAEKIKRADILLLGSAIWLGEPTSTLVRVMERIYGGSGETNDKGQYPYYGKVGGIFITGNEDGYKNVARQAVYGLSHMGFTIPPQPDAGWVGEAGPGQSYGDTPEDEPNATPAGYDNDFTQKNAVFTSWNCLHLARMLKDAGGIPAYGNVSKDWKDGDRFGHPYPQYLKLDN